LFSRIFAHIRILRPINMLMIGATSLLGYHLAYGDWLSPRCWLTALAIALVSGAGYITNDLVDLPTDRLNRPQRPLPSGRVSVPAAMAMAVVIGLTALAMGFWLGWQMLIFTAVLIVTCLTYSLWLKPQAPWGNLAVGALTASSLPFGALSAGGLDQRLILPTALAFLLNLAREIYKDVEDTSGDMEMKARTLPIILGPEPAVKVGGVVLLAYAVFAVLLYFQGGWGWGYLVTIIPLGAIPATVMSALSFFRPKKVNSGLIQRGIKILMLVTLIAIIIGFNLR